MRITLKLSEERKGSRFYRDLRIVCVCVCGEGVLYRRGEGGERERGEGINKMSQQWWEKRGNLTKKNNKGALRIFIF